MAIGRCTIKRIKVDKDGDPMGSADMWFSMGINDTTTFIGRYTGVDGGDTLGIGQSFVFRLDDILRIQFTAVDEDGGKWGDDDDVATGLAFLDTQQLPLPRIDASLMISDAGVKATIVFDLSMENMLSEYTGLNSAIRCMGDIEGPRWLDGNTVVGDVGLAPTNVAPYTGSAWRIHDLGDDRVALECLGNVPGPKWLDGNTINGSVRLAPQTDGGFTGTSWRPHDAGGSLFRLECLGNVPGRRWLDGNTVTGAVGLVDAAEIGFSGTHWQRQ